MKKRKIKLKSKTLFFKKPRKEYFLLFIFAITLITGLFFCNLSSIQAASYTWNQTDWSGGLDEGTYPNHLDNQNNWIKYNSEDKITVGSELIFSSESEAATQASYDDFNAGILNQVEIGQFSYKKPITISGNTEEFIDYPMLVVVDTQTLISEGKMQADCDDIRFYDIGNVTSLNYWIESGCNTSTTKIWVKTLSIPTGGATMHMEYGNSGVASESSESGVFGETGVVSGWKLDVTSGCNGETIATIPSTSWQTGSTCVSGSCAVADNIVPTLDFDYDTGYFTWFVWSYSDETAIVSRYQIKQNYLKGLDNLYSKGELSGVDYNAKVTALGIPINTLGDETFAGVSLGSVVDNSTHKKTINISENTESFTDYQMLVTVNTRSLISKSKMQDDCDDIRFYDSDGVTSLNYWIESGCNTRETKVWVKIPSVPSAGTTIYMEYNDFGVGSASNKINVFGETEVISGRRLDTLCGANSETVANIPSSLWQTESACVLGSCSADNNMVSTLDFDYNTGYYTWFVWTYPDGSSTILRRQIKQNYLAGLNDLYSKGVLSEGDYNTKKGVLGIPTYIVGGDTSSFETSGDFISSSQDLGIILNFDTFDWIADVPSGTGLKFQLASNSDNETWNFIGPDGTNATYYTTSGQNIPSSHDGDRYVKYKAYFSTTDNMKTPSLSSVSINYIPYGYLISSPYDTADDTNALGKVEWTADTPSGTSVKFQVRTAPLSSGTWTSWMGPDGTDTSFFTDPTGSQIMPEVLRDGTDDQWIQYKVILETLNSNIPSLQEVMLKYAINAPPEIDLNQGVSAVQNANGTVSINYFVRDIDTNSAVPENQGHVSASFEYWNGTSWQPCTTLNEGDTTNEVQEQSYTEYTATWYPKTDFNEQFMNNTAKIRVTIDDNEVANNTITQESNLFTIETKDPINTSLYVDASTQYDGNPATLHLTAEDDSAMSMIISLNSDFAGAEWETYANTSTITLNDESDIVYVNIKDVYGNNVSLNRAYLNTPLGVMSQDTSNVILEPNEYRIFISWQEVSPPAQGEFAYYSIYRSTTGNDADYEELAGSHVANIHTNYYTDTSITAQQTQTLFYYKVVAVDSFGNTTFRSNAITGMANGTQDYGEGGGGTEIQAPTITNVTTSNISSTQATITWTTDELSDSTVEFSIGDTTYNISQGVPTMVTSHSVTLTSLTPNSQYFFRVKSLDPSSNAGISDNSYTFNTTAGPVISNISIKSIFNEEAVITWLTNESSDSHVELSINANMSDSNSHGSENLITTLNSQEYYEHSVRLTGLTQATKYYFYVKSKDVNTNEAFDNNAGEYYSFTTTYDSTGPVISNISVSTTLNTAIITWTTDELSSSQVQHGTTIAYGGLTEKDNTLTIQHSVRVPELYQNCSYHFKVVSEDANGNISISDDNTFLTNSLNSEDITPDTGPVISNVTVSTVSDTKATITWDTSENASSQIQYGTTTSYGTSTTEDTALTIKHAVMLTDLTLETTYYFKVLSKDFSDNLTQDDNDGESYSFTTTKKPGPVIIQNIISSGGGSSIDRTKPIMKDITISNITSTSAEIAWKSSEQTNTFIEYGETETYEKGSYGNPYDSTVKHSLNLTFLRPATTYFYRVVGLDSYGNIGSSKQQSFATLDASGNEIEISTTSNTEETAQTGGSSNISYTDESSIVEDTINTIKSLRDAYSLKFISAALQETAKKVINPPVVIDGNIQIEVTASKAIFTWTTDKKTHTLIKLVKNGEYDEKLEDSYNIEVGGSNDFVLDHEIVVQGLEPSTIYHYQIISTPVIGETSRTEDNVFKTDGFIPEYFLSELHNIYKSKNRRKE